jgi:hypothetical protein
MEKDLIEALREYPSGVEEVYPDLPKLEHCVLRGLCYVSLPFSRLPHVARDSLPPYLDPEARARVLVRPPHAQKQSRF